MITDNEIDYIKIKWLSHKQLEPYYWGKLLHAANPEVYLAEYRGAIFVQKKGYISLDAVSLDAVYLFVNSGRNYLYEFSWSIMKEWSEFLHYENTLKYEISIAQNKELVIQKIVYALTNHMTERIYTL